MFEISDLQRLFKQQPKNTLISGIKNLSSFIQTYPNDQLKSSLYKLQAIHQHYRAVNGDGNCFYRAIMFLYLTQANLFNYQVLFPAADLLKCKNLPFKASKNMTSQHLLQYLWQTELLPFGELAPDKREKQIEKMVNKSAGIDSILIAYFRALNYNYLSRNRVELQPFTDGGIEEDLNRVLVFGKESQGIEIYSLSKILNIAIQIKMVNPETVQTIVYNNEASGKRYKLFYRPGHYDIISDSRNVQRQQTHPERLSASHYYDSRDSRDQNFIPSSARESFISQNSSQGQSRVIHVAKPEDFKLVRQSHLQNKSNGKQEPFQKFIQSTSKKSKQKLDGSQKHQKIYIQNLEQRSDNKPKQENKKVTKLKSGSYDSSDQAFKKRLKVQASLFVLALASVAFYMLAF